MRLKVKDDALARPWEFVASYGEFSNSPQLVVEIERTYLASWLHHARQIFDLLFPEQLSHHRARTVILHIPKRISQKQIIKFDNIMHSIVLLLALKAKSTHLIK